MNDDKSQQNKIESAVTSRQLLHDLNQPLTAIGNYAQAGHQLLDAGQMDCKQLGMLFEKILAQSARASSLSRELRDAIQPLIGKP